MASVQGPLFRGQLARDARLAKDAGHTFPWRIVDDAGCVYRAEYAMHVVVQFSLGDQA